MIDYGEQAYRTRSGSFLISIFILGIYVFGRFKNQLHADFFKANFDFFTFFLL